MLSNLLRFGVLSLAFVLTAPALAASMNTMPSTVGKPAEPSEAAHGAMPRSAIEAQNDTPPPSSWDLRQRDEEPAPPPPTESSLMAQVGRTLIALTFVVVLIYLVTKLGLPRLYRNLTRPGAGQLKILERAQLDAKHAVILMEAGDGVRLLLGCGDGGVQLLAELPSPGGPSFHPHMGNSPGGDAKGNRDAKIN